MSELRRGFLYIGQRVLFESSGCEVESEARNETTQRGARGAKGRAALNRQRAHAVSSIRRSGSSSGRSGGMFSVYWGVARCLVTALFFASREPPNLSRAPPYSFTATARVSPRPSSPTDRRGPARPTRWVVLCSVRRVILSVIGSTTRRVCFRFVHLSTSCGVDKRP